MSLLFSFFFPSLLLLHDSWLASKSDPHHFLISPLISSDRIPDPRLREYQPYQSYHSFVLSLSSFSYLGYMMRPLRSISLLPATTAFHTLPHAGDEENAAMIMR